MRSLILPPSVTTLLLATLLIAGPAEFSVAAPAPDQAKVEPGATLADLQAGNHVFGPEFKADDMLGKVIVVNIGGA